MTKYGVIDLGTNTFHLLIIETAKSGTWTTVHKERIFVKLAEDGIEKIGAKAYHRGINALAHFQKILLEKKVTQVKAFGTAALRTASNGMAFIQDAQWRTGIIVDIIPGTEEARLIHLGVTQAVEFGDQKGLVMDIGGGSVEFIIADKNQVFWAESFQLGVAILKKEFHHNEPIVQNEIQRLNDHLSSTLRPLFQVLKTHQPFCLLGASGTFDVLEALLPHTQTNTLSATLNVKDFAPLYQSIIPMNLKERLADERIPNSRADMIVVALILIQFILQHTDIQEIIASKYAMKEGILWEMITAH